MALSAALVVALVTSSTAARADGAKKGGETATALAQDSAPRPKAKPRPAAKHKAKAHARTKAKAHPKTKVASKHHASKHKATAHKPRKR